MDHPTKKPTVPYTQEEKQNFIQQWHQSGLSRLAFCLKNNLSYYSLLHWTRKPKKTKNVKSTGFIPLKVKPSPELLFAQIEFGNGKHLQLFQTVPASYLKQILC